MKKLLIFLCSLLLATGTAQAAFDYTPYQLQGYYPPMGVQPLADGAVAASAWEYQDGSGERYLTWWKDGAMIRTLLLPHELYGFNLLVRDDSTLALLQSSVNEATRDSAAVLYVCQLCAVDESGFSSLVEVSDAVINLHRQHDGCFALFELRGGQAWLNLYEGTPEWSWSIPMDVKKPMDLYLSRVTRDGDRWLIVYNPNGIRSEDSYRLLCVQNGALLWDRPLPASCAILGDGHGGYYLSHHTGSGNYRPIVMYHFDADGNQLAHKTLNTNKLVLGVSMQREPASGQLHLYGTAVANSRKVYTVWLMACDADLNPLTDIDVRDCSYHGDYSPGLTLDANGACSVFLQASDASEAAPVLVPFDALPAIQNPGVSLQ